jgi:hypothetical protein
MPYLTASPASVSVFRICATWGRRRQRGRARVRGGARSAASSERAAGAGAARADGGWAAVGGGPRRRTLCLMNPSDWDAPDVEGSLNSSEGGAAGREDSSGAADTHPRSVVVACSVIPAGAHAGARVASPRARLRGAPPAGGPLPRRGPELLRARVLGGRRRRGGARNISGNECGPGAGVPWRGAGFLPLVRPHRRPCPLPSPAPPWGRTHRAYSARRRLGHTRRGGSGGVGGGRGWGRGRQRWTAAHGAHRPGAGSAAIHSTDGPLAARVAPTQPRGRLPAAAAAQRTGGTPGRAPSTMTPPARPGPAPAPAPRPPIRRPGALLGLRAAVAGCGAVHVLRVWCFRGASQRGSSSAGLGTGREERGVRLVKALLLGGRRRAGRGTMGEARAAPRGGGKGR